MEATGALRAHVDEAGYQGDGAGGRTACWTEVDFAGEYAFFGGGIEIAFQRFSMCRIVQDVRGNRVPY